MFLLCCSHWLKYNLKSINIRWFRMTYYFSLVGGEYGHSPVEYGKKLHFKRVDKIQRTKDIISIFKSRFNYLLIITYKLPIFSKRTMYVRIKNIRRCLRYNRNYYYYYYSITVWCPSAGNVLFQTGSNHYT